MTKTYTIPIDLPEGWEPVAFRLGESNEPYYDPATKSICRLLMESSVGVLIVQKTKPRRIVLEETGETLKPGECKHGIVCVHVGDIRNINDIELTIWHVVNKE